MTNSMKDLLLGLGFSPPPKAVPPTNTGNPQRRAPSRQKQAAPQSPAAPRQQPHRGKHPPQERASPQRARSQEEIDLGKAYALRAQREKNERIEAERVKQDAARIKREAKAKVAELLKDKALNDAAADLTRHFNYNGKIRRVHVNESQLKALNRGELAVVQLDGRYLLVETARAIEVQKLLPSLLALLVDPDAPAPDDPYADPQYAVPDDLVW